MYILFKQFLVILFALALYACDGNTLTVNLDSPSGGTNDNPVSGSDTVDPAVAITSVANNATLTGTIAITVDATDNSGIANIEFYAGNELVGTITSFPYTLNWDSASLSDGTYTLTVIVTDTSGNTSQDTATVVLANGVNDIIDPTASFISPTNGASITGNNITLQATGTDNIGIASILYQINGSAIGTAVTSSPFTANLDASSLTDGTNYTLTAIASDYAGNTDSTSITVTYSAYSSIDTPTKVFLTTDRINRIKNIRDNGHEIWTYFIGRLNAELTGSPPFNSAEYSSAFALGYRMTGNVEYLNRAIELFWYFYDSSNDYNNDNNAGAWDYRSRNGFRGAGRFAHLTFDWIKDSLSQTEIDEFTDLFTEWAQYWEGEVNYASNFDLYRWQDSDQATSLTENFLLMAISMESASDNSYASTLFNIADGMTDLYITNYFMSDIMEGGVWAEGTDYSPNTMQHWIRQYIINKEYRAVTNVYTNNSIMGDYADDLVTAMWHNTLPGFTSMFEFGDMEDHTDYTLPHHEYRDELMILLTAAVDDPALKAVSQNWLERARHGTTPSASSYTGLWRILFEQVYGPTSTTPADAGIPLEFYAPGVEMVSFRSSWDDNADVVYFQNGLADVDHQHHDALSFNIFSEGDVITKEVTGYGLPAAASSSHNTLLVQNSYTYPSDAIYFEGTSDPHSRAVGEGTINAISSDDVFGFVDADATNIYNGTDVADNNLDYVQRKLFYIKPLKFVAVYDYIQVMANKSPKWKQYIQHTQTEPSNSGDIYSATADGGKTLYLQTLLPTDAVTTVVNETSFYDAAPTWAIPPNQRKWHLRVEPGTDADSIEFLNILHFNTAGASSMPAVTRIADSSSSDMTGLHITDSSPNYAILFNNNPTGALPSFPHSYQIDTTSTNTHYITGLAASSNYTVNASLSGTTITVSVSEGGSLMTNAEGILEFTLNSNGILQ